MCDAYKTLPELSKKQKEEWVTDKLLNLSKKKKDAWLLLCGVGKSDNSLKLKYHYLDKEAAHTHPQEEKLYYQ